MQVLRHYLPDLRRRCTPWVENVWKQRRPDLTRDASRLRNLFLDVCAPPSVLGGEKRDLKRTAFSFGCAAGVSEDGGFWSLFMVRRMRRCFEAFTDVRKS